MKKYLIIILFLVSTTITLAQERVLTFTNDLKTSSSNIKDVIPVVNKKNGEIVYIVADAKNVYAYKINSDFKVVDKLSSPEKSRKYKILIGSDIDENDNYSIFLTNKNKDSFLVLHLSFETKTIITTEFKIPNNEFFVQSTNLENRFYLLCSSRVKNEIYAYVFENNEKQKNTISTDGFVFLTRAKGRKKANEMLLLTKGIKKFDENIPNTIEVTSTKNKMFERESGVVFAFNDNDSYSQLLFLDLKNFTASTKYFKNPLSELKNSAKNSNSYINGDHIFTFSVSKRNFAFKVYDIDNEDLVKSYNVGREEEIPFKNMPIIQEGGMYSSFRELTKTKQFIRKIYSGNVGITVKKFDDFYHIVMGGYVVQKSGGMMMPFGGLPIASIGSATIFFNPAQIAFNSFGNNKATRIECLFDENFEHLQGEVPENAFDKMKDFKSNNKGGTVFKYKDYYIKTAYGSFSKEFKFRKFTD